jgi:nucleoside phosphorylase
MKPRIEETWRQLRAARNTSAPYYGDDFWDWAAVLEAFLEVHSHCVSAVSDDSAIQHELKSFYESVSGHIANGLTINNTGEWYGPATAAIAYRVLEKSHDHLGTQLNGLLDQLREQALEPIENGEYCGRAVVGFQVLWHYGQVVAEFPGQDTSKQAAEIKDLSTLTTLEKSEQVYALARVLQGALKTRDCATVDRAITTLFDCQDLNRPLGQGIMGDNIKGSLNVLDALWPALTSDEKIRIASMIDALLRLHSTANTVGIVVAVDREAKATRDAFSKAGGKADTNGDCTIIEHSDYRVVICKGKGLIGATDATRTLIDKYKSKWLIMCGIAGSLGKYTQRRGKRPEFRGPDKGHVVIGTSIAPFRIRDKVRQQIENAKVPLRGTTWMIIPADPTLFSLAHEVGDQRFGDTKTFHEGLVVTGTGIKDALAAKNEILKEFPGGLAVEEEGYVVGLLCMASGIPYLVIRGISDRAEGDKQKQKSDPQKEASEQRVAARAAAEVAVNIVELLSQRW